MTEARALRALFPSWILAMEAVNKSPRTVEGDTASLELFARWLEDNDHPVDPDEITTRLLRTWIVELVDTRSASTDRTRWNGLRSFFAWAAEEHERARELLVVGKGNRERIVVFVARTARAFDRYLRMRARSKYAEGPWLWISGKDGKALTTNAVQQMMKRRGAAAGVPELHTHMFRHGFADAWLASGGNEGDLMELAGWRSRQMLARYGAGNRARRAREAYQGRSPMDNLG
ncbi:tyrosine-type recombinase/integrase [Nocardioides sp. zg-ZUI104]|uniref:tyrosine-type recombinase/integrase n=1 Tax=Nocardioides faecalis TaxID=2803858 RepID=UPI001BCDEC61|nr:tyrosine-type recombinase/integrase [Nocardioides faecalis]MBS4754735.1 tyrosine-type recombinase/integrase [Nocardioides faecalis]